MVSGGHQVGQPRDILLRTRAAHRITQSQVLGWREGPCKYTQCQPGLTQEHGQVKCGVSLCGNIREPGQGDGDGGLWEK